MNRKLRSMGSNTSQNADVLLAMDSLRRVVRALRESSRMAERRFGLSGAQLFVLRKLAERSPISLNELARLTRTHQSSVSTVVSRLVRRRLVRRVRSERDARMVQLTLTAAGARVGKRSPDVAQERLAAAIEGLAPARRKALASTLHDIAKALGSVAGIPEMLFDEPSRGPSD
jgi:MarR family transcriptional regulator, lower aerobic nicotinate degradation pathway regulator